MRETKMTQTIIKSEFLDDLKVRNQDIREIVQTQFIPLDQVARTTQPAPGEWCVDQCFEHLVITFDSFLPQVTQGLYRGIGTIPVERFKPSWFASLTPYRNLFNPKQKTKTLPYMTPSEHYYPEVFERFLAQKDRLSNMLDEATEADLQVRCWYLKFAPINLGDYFELYVLHDELHIDQAQRALAAYRLNVA
jgi:hypothetical protein